MMDHMTMLGGIIWLPSVPPTEWLAGIGFGAFVLMMGAGWTDLLGGLSNKKQSRLAEVLKPYYDLYEIEQATQHYIPTRYQRVGAAPVATAAPHPVIEEDSQKLMPFLLNSPETRETTHCLVMADSGIGKTTFMLNLYQTCAFDKQYQRPVELFPMRDPSTLAAVANLPNRSSLTLLLDGFNEDPQAIANYERRLGEVMAQTQGFGQVIITCRTRFFSNELDEPMEVYLQHIAASGSLPFTSIHLSTFSEEEVRRYIKKKYSLWHRSKRRRAMEIIDQAPHLMEQPLLLSFAEDLLDGQRSYQQTYEIYEDLVTTWIAKATYPQPLDRRESFQQALYDVMLGFSMGLYQQHHGGERMFLSEAQVQSVLAKHRLRLDDIETEGRSLFSHYTHQGYRFTHNSIMEYFLAQEAYQNLSFLQKVSFAGLDQAQRFLLEMILSNDLTLVEGGTATLGKDDQTAQPVIDFFMAHHPVTIGQYRRFCNATSRAMPELPSWGDEPELPMIMVNWEDAQAYCRWLSSLTGHRFRLPTEIEWEYAARGGRKPRRYPYAGSKTLEQVAWFADNSERRAHPVGIKQANELGLHDLSGQVWEWCQDWYCLDPADASGGDSAASPGRAIRGGSWLNHESSCRVDSRGFSEPENRTDTIGFRIVAEMPEL